MIDKIKEYIEEVDAFTAKTKEDVEAFRIKFSGKKGLINEFFAEFRSKLLRDRMRHSQNRNLSCQPVILLSIRFLHWRRD